MKRFEAFVVLGLFLALAIIAIVGEMRYAASIRPTETQTLSDHLVRFGSPQLIYRVAHNGRTFFELQGFPHGQRPSFAFPSSAPTYIYDANGHLVDWCPDPGDSSTHSSKWLRVSHTPINLQTLRNEVDL